MNNAGSTLSLINLLVVQIETAGNGITEIGVARSSKLTVTGRCCHFCQMITIDRTHTITDRTNDIIHQSLKEKFNFWLVKYFGVHRNSALSYKFFLIKMYTSQSNASFLP